jgi:hypothetical protein
MESPRFYETFVPSINLHGVMFHDTFSIILYVSDFDSNINPDPIGYSGF